MSKPRCVALCVATLLSSMTLVSAGVGGDLRKATVLNKGARHAIIVAVPEYGISELTPISGADAEAERLKTALTASGYAKTNIAVLKRGATRSQIISAIQSKSLKLGIEDSLLVVMIGHGVHLEGKSYFCGADATKQSLTDATAAKATLVPVDTITGDMSQCAAERKLLVLDACQDADYVKDMQNLPEGLWVITSCSEGEKSWRSPYLKDGESRTVFTHFLTKGFYDADFEVGDGDGHVSVLELYAYAFARTQEHMQAIDREQHPELFGELVSPFVLTGTAARKSRGLLVANESQLKRMAASRLAQSGIAAMLTTGQAFKPGQSEADRVEAKSRDREKMCDVLGTQLAMALELDPQCRLAHLGRAWCFRAAGMYREALAASKRAGRPLDVFVVGDVSQLDDMTTTKDDKPIIAVAESNNKPGGRVEVRLEPDAESASVGSVSGFSKVQVDLVSEDDEWVRVISENDTPIDTPGWLAVEDVAWYRAATQSYAPSTPMTTEPGTRIRGGSYQLDRVRNDLRGRVSQMSAPRVSWGPSLSVVGDKIRVAKQWVDFGRGIKDGNFNIPGTDVRFNRGGMSAGGYSIPFNRAPNYRQFIPGRVGNILGRFGLGMPPLPEPQQDGYVWSGQSGVQQQRYSQYPTVQNYQQPAQRQVLNRVRTSAEDWGRNAAEFAAEAKEQRQTAASERNLDPIVPRRVRVDLSLWAKD